ncbi:MAG: tRNA pseudouridine(55) synthase TruB [Nitrospirae bacterium]|nr:tRNA pseudouridine(55) synthase TruB [Nitrospirota bacterium]
MNRDIVINLDKPKGISSHQAVERVRRMLKVGKAGHAGTLDPIATGVLLVCTGEATKVTRFLSDFDKEYSAVVKLGERTDTYDSEGSVVGKTGGFSFEKKDVERVLPQFIGTVEQTPPMYSAIKMRGKPLYKLARAGITVERPKRTVTIREIVVTGFRFPFFSMRVSCSKGTYVRSLCNDIGEALGVGAHMTELRRTRAGNFLADDSLTLERLEEISGRESENVFSPGICGIDAALGRMEELLLTESEFRRAKNGVSPKSPGRALPQEEYLRLKDPSGNLFAIGKTVDGAVRIERILHLR